MLHTSRTQTFFPILFNIYFFPSRFRGSSVQGRVGRKNYRTFFIGFNVIRIVFVWDIWGRPNVFFVIPTGGVCCLLNLQCIRNLKKILQNKFYFLLKLQLSLKITFIIILSSPSTVHKSGSIKYLIRNFPRISKSCSCHHCSMSLITIWYICFYGSSVTIASSWSPLRNLANSRAVQWHEIFRLRNYRLLFSLLAPLKRNKNSPASVYIREFVEAI